MILIFLIGFFVLILLLYCLIVTVLFVELVLFLYVYYIWLFLWFFLFVWLGFGGFVKLITVLHLSISTDLMFGMFILLSFCIVVFLFDSDFVCLSWFFDCLWFLAGVWVFVFCFLFLSWFIIILSLILFSFYLLVILSIGCFCFVFGFFVLQYMSDVIVYWMIFIYFMLNQ